MVRVVVRDRVRVKVRVRVGVRPGFRIWGGLGTQYSDWHRDRGVSVEIGFKVEVEVGAC